MICRTAQTKYTKRIKEVSGTEDAELMSSVDTAVPRGRQTIVEFNFMEGLVQSMTNPAAARPLLNQTISSMDSAKLLQSDIEPTIWGFVGRVLRGDPLE